jgi:hypothetical protein
MSWFGLLNCREAALLMTRSEYEPLPTTPAVGLRVHLGLCRHCRAFREQQRLMSQATQRWRAQNDPDAPE